MDKRDVDRLFNLLETLCPRDGKHTRDRATLAAWAAVLEPYDYEQVKAAAVARARENRFFPDPAELVAHLPRREEAPGTPTPDSLSGLDALVEMGQLMKLDYLSKGIPHPADARRLGWSAEVWNERVHAEFPDVIPCN